MDMVQIEATRFLLVSGWTSLRNFRLGGLSFGSLSVNRCVIEFFMFMSGASVNFT